MSLPAEWTIGVLPPVLAGPRPAHLRLLPAVGAAAAATAAVVMMDRAT